jgi:hypothetical protein
MTRRDWETITNWAKRIVNEYDYLITLRQLHYRLVMEPYLEYENTLSDYKRLSELTAQQRRQCTFPALLDQTRTITVASSWTSPGQGLRALAQQYRRPRSEGQEHLVVLAGEKATLLAQLAAWFDQLGAPIVLLRGYGSQTYVDDVTYMVDADGRPAVLIYAGDLDPSGEDILRDFTERCDVWKAVEHIAVRREQIAELGLAVNPGKRTDSRAAAFTARHGELIQVEVEAIEPGTLRGLYQTALDRYWAMSMFEASLEREQQERNHLVELAAREEGGADQD